MSIKVGKRYSALSYTKAFGWSQKHFLVDPSFFFSFFFPQISSLHHVQLLFLPIFGLSIIFIFIKKHSGWITQSHGGMHEYSFKENYKISTILNMYAMPLAWKIGEKDDSYVQTCFKVYYQVVGNVCRQGRYQNKVLSPAQGQPKFR